MKKINIVQLMLIALLMTSCKSMGNFTYFGDMEDGLLYPIKEQTEVVVQNNDRLNIVVTCKEPDLAKVFNIREAVLATADMDSKAKATPNGYKVNAYGDIEFPLLGKLHVAGLTLPQVSELIKNKIIADEYIKDPIVVTDILNFKYTVLGATGPGVYTSEDGEVTILDAIAKAGDVKDIGRLDRIAVIREIDGQRQITHLDLKSKNIFDSPCYYLQQNDIVYVEPKYRTNTRGERSMSMLAILLSFITSISTVAYLLK